MTLKCSSYFIDLFIFHVKISCIYALLSPNIIKDIQKCECFNKKNFSHRILLQNKFVNNILLKYIAGSFEENKVDETFSNGKESFLRLSK